MDDLIAKQTIQSRSDNTLAGGGEMGILMRAQNWQDSPFGSVELWPQSLRTAVSICLASRFPIILFWGKDLRQFYNDAYRPILGKTKHPQALGQRAQECWPEIWDVIGPMFNSVIITGEATWSENQLLLLDRNGYVEECYFTFSYSPIRDESGEVGGVFCAVTETTTEVLNERRLRALRALAANAAQAKTIEETCQITVETLLDHPADLPFSLLYMLDTNGGSARLVGTTGISVGTCASPHTIALSSPDAVWPFSQIVDSGKPALLDDLSQRFGATWNTLFDQERPISHSALILPILRAGETLPYGFLVAGVNPRNFLDTEYHGFFILLVGQIAAATAAAQAYQEAQERAEALAELDRAKTTFFSNISHELRTPLTLLLGPLEAVLADPQHSLDDDYRTHLEMARRNGLRQLKLVNALLDFSRIEAGRMQAVYTPTDLADLTLNLASVFRSAIEGANLRFIVECPPLPEPIYVDREMWEKIVLNLLSNAFKFTFEGQIRVSLHMVDDAVLLSITDTGIGIHAEDLPRLFERFYQVREQHSRIQEGSGIGLSFVQELVRLLGGTIDVSSTAGKGTTFTVRLPRGSAHLPPAQIRTTRPLSSTPIGVTASYIEEVQRLLPEDQTYLDMNQMQDFPQSDLAQQQASTLSGDVPARVLIVDDNTDMRDYLAHLLSPFYTLQVAADGYGALHIARTWHPDLILSDVMMPVMDGFALLHAIRADPLLYSIPILLLSARAGEEATIEGLQIGADDYLVKPFSARELLARVRARIEIASLLERERAALTEAEIARQRVDTFLGIASHELKSPMTSIKGNVQLAMRRVTRVIKSANDHQEIRPSLEEVQNMLERGLRQINFLNRLVGDLVDVARIQAEKLELRIAPANLNTVVQEAVDEQRLMTPTRTIHLTLLPGETPTPMIDAERIGQVVMNYLSNALKYSEAEKAISITVSQDGPSMRVAVSDNGPGLSADKQKRIWERFYRVPEIAVKSGSGVGLGLGLYICRTIIEQHGGQVGVESIEGQGSTFWFTLPIADQQIAQEQ